jgi:hypothetical protein
MPKKISKDVEAVARAMEKHFHKGGGVCDERDDGPDNCWRSMVDFAEVAVAAIRSQSKRGRGKA